MSGDESDESISTEEMQDNIKEKNSSVERIKPKRKMSEKQLENLRLGREKREANKKPKEDKLPQPKIEIKPKIKKIKKTEPLETELDNTVNEIIEPVVEAPAPVKKKTRGRPKKPEGEKGKIIEKTIVEKYYYLAPIGPQGEYEKVSVKKITPKNAHIHENIQKSNQMMEDDNTNYRLKKNGQVDKRSANRGEKKLRTEKQIAAAKALGQRTKEKYAKLKEEKTKKLKQTIEDTIVDVVSQPIQKVKEKHMEQRKSLEEKQKEQLLKNKSLFS